LRWPWPNTRSLWEGAIREHDRILDALTLRIGERLASILRGHFRAPSELMGRSHNQEYVAGSVTPAGDEYPRETISVPFEEQERWCFLLQCLRIRGHRW